MGNQIASCLQSDSPEIANSLKEKECDINGLPDVNGKVSFHQLSTALEAKFPVAKSDRIPSPHQQYTQVLNNQKEHKNAEKKRIDLIPTQEELLKYLVHEAKASLSFQENILKAWKKRTNGKRKNFETEKVAFALNKKIKVFEDICKKLQADKQSRLEDKVNVAAFSASLFLKDEAVQDFGSTRVFYESILYPLKDPNYASNCVKNGSIFTESPRSAWGKRGTRAILNLGRSVLGSESVSGINPANSEKWTMYDVIKYPYVNPLEIAIAMKQQSDSLKVVKDRIDTHQHFFKSNKSTSDARSEELSKGIGDYIKYYPALIKKALDCKVSNNTSCKGFSSENFVASVCRAGEFNAIEKHEREEISTILKGVSVLALPLAFLAPGPGTVLFSALLNSATLVDSIDKSQMINKDRSQITAAITTQFMDKKLGTLLNKLLDEKIQSEMAASALAIGGLGLNAIEGTNIIRSLRPVPSVHPRRIIVPNGTTQISSSTNSLQSESKFIKAYSLEKKISASVGGNQFDVQLMQASKLPADEKIRDIINALESKGIKIAIGDSPFGTDAAFLGKELFVGQALENTSVILISPNLLKNEDSFLKLLNHELTHWVTLEKVGVTTHHGGALTSDNGTLSVSDYNYSAYNDEVKTYSRQSLYSMRGKSEPEVQNLFQKSSGQGVPYKEVIKDIKITKSDLGYALDFAKDQQVNFSALANEISEDHFVFKLLNIEKNGNPTIQTGISDHTYILDMQRTTMASYEAKLKEIEALYKSRTDKAMKELEHEFRKSNDLDYFNSEKDSLLDYTQREIQRELYQKNAWLKDFENLYRNHVNILNNTATENVKILTESVRTLSQVENQGSITLAQYSKLKNGIAKVISSTISK